MTQRSVIINSSVNYTGSGKLRSIIIKDTFDVNVDFDATISVNLDGAGAVTLTINDLLGHGGTTGSKAGIPGIMTGDNAIGIVKASSTDYTASKAASIQLDLNMFFTSSCVISVSNADSYLIIYDVDVY